MLLEACFGVDLEEVALANSYDQEEAQVKNLAEAILHVVLGESVLEDQEAYAQEVLLRMP